MDSPAQARAYAEADFSESNALFARRFLGDFPDAGARGRMLDLGCGPADICIRLATALPGWEITALDAGENMLREAARAIAAAGRRKQIALRLARLPDPGLEQAGYDAVISNSLLHHLPDPLTLWQAVAQAGRPGAAVMVMDLARPASEDDARALVETHAADAPAILQEDFFNSLLAAYAPAEVARQLRQAGLSHLALDLPSDRHWIVSGRLPG